MLGIQLGTILGVALLVVGIMTIKNKDISLIYRMRYKYQFVDENSKAECSKDLGLSVIIMAVGCLMLPYLGKISNAYWIGVIIILLGYIKLMLTIKKINKKIF
ncbi:MAG: hypothetical protein E7235_07405 [Lachnospiraceae bacterium]|nr:hypothetical protein [Lachnospiraceae bacterium]